MNRHDLKTLAALGATALLAACSGGSDEADATDDPGTTAELDCAEAYDTYEPGMSKQGLDYTYTMLSADPDPPDRGENTWEIEVTDVAGAPVAGLPLLVEPFMPEHDHGTNPATFDAEDLGDGVYRFTDIDLFMPGLWQLFVRVDDGSAAEQTDADPAVVEQAEFRFCLQG